MDQPLQEAFYEITKENENLLNSWKREGNWTYQLPSNQFDKARDIFKSMRQLGLECELEVLDGFCQLNIEQKQFAP